MIRLLMVEDDLEITALLESYLKQFDIQITSYDNPQSALDNLAIDVYDLIVLDLTLPQMDGIQLLKRIRERSDIPIIISTARHDMADKVLGFEYGADDYLPKPYEPRELVLRINSILKRYNVTNSTQKVFLVNQSKMEITKNGTLLELTTAEYEVLSLLIKNQGNVISREYIANNVNSISWENSDTSINMIISRIRHKIEDDSKNPKYIRSIRGMGYKFVQ